MVESNESNMENPKKRIAFILAIILGFILIGMIIYKKHKGLPVQKSGPLFYPFAKASFS